METMQPDLKNGRNTWDRINMPEAEFQDRVNKNSKRDEERDGWIFSSSMETDMMITGIIPMSE